jgi:malate permease and related proteins
MFFDAVGITASAVMQILILAIIGFFLKKRNILTDQGLDAISRLVIDITLPLLIFAQLVKDFDFNRYPNWWIFPLLSLAITAMGLVVGFICSGFIRGAQRRLQFLNLVAFQNSGYLPLAMVATLLPAQQVGRMFIYLFLFLIGFNMVMGRRAAYLLTFSKETKFQARNLLNPPVIAAVFGLVFAFFDVQCIVPEVVLKPMRMIGDCTLPLAMFVVGADLAQIKVEHFDRKAMAWLTLAKLIILPLLGLTCVLRFNLPPLMGLLILLQLAVPPATSLSVIVRHYRKEDLLISQGIFFGHVVSLLTIPVFLSIYLSSVSIK